MVVFRLSREQFSYELSGKGAALRGARWNSAGVELIYAACNRSLAMAEVAVHLSFSMLPTNYVMMTTYIPDNVQIEIISEFDLPKNWNDFPHPVSTQKVGDNFVFNQNAVALKIPSVVTKGDFNLLINPKHPDFSKIKIVETEPFPFDTRLFKS